LSPWGYDLKSPEITVKEMDNDGNELSIAPPDGKSSHRSDEGAFSSWEQNNWWRAMSVWVSIIMIVSFSECSSFEV